MSEAYFNLKKQLEKLGYNKHLPVDAAPLVECLTADLLQTTRSLQHYMKISQEAIQQRDDLMLQAEPYKCDNARLIKENIQLNKLLLELKEESQRIAKANMRKIQSLSDEIASKEETVNKLKYQCRDLGLRSLCAGTLSSRNKMRTVEKKDTVKRDCECSNRDSVAMENQIIELKKEIHNLKDGNEKLTDENELLSVKVEQRDSEIVRLHLLLEGGRPLYAVMKDCCDKDMGGKISMLFEECKTLENENANLMKQLDQSVEKQHEAMMRALNLADKNKLLEEELSKLDKLALTVEEECNKQINTKYHENIYLHEKVEELMSQNTKLKRDLAERRHDSIEKIERTVTEIQTIKECLNQALKEKDVLCDEIKILQNLNKSLEEKLVTALSQADKLRNENRQDMVSYFATKEDLKDLIGKERKDYESHSLSVQNKMAEALEYFNKNINSLKVSTKPPDNKLIYDLHSKICECEHKLLELKTENEHLQSKLLEKSGDRCLALEELIADLKTENSDLRKENNMLTGSINHYKQRYTGNEEIDQGKMRITINKLNNEIENLIHKNSLLQREKKEYMLKCNEANDEIDSLKRDLLIKNSLYEQLQEENCSHRINNRSGRASVDHLKDECIFLREQMSKMQTEIMKEKTLSSQIKNIQIETERSNNEVQNELHTARKQLSISRDQCVTLERKCEDFQCEILSLRMEKSKLLENIKILDKEKQKMMNEFSSKAETLSMLEQKLKSKSYAIERLEIEITELKQKNILSNISEHKLMDSEAKLQFLNGEVKRLTQENENASIEINHLQKSLADANTALNMTKMKHEKSRKDADGLRLQLQHYVAEVKRIEDLLSRKEAERADMLEHFASLSVEANILENNNHSLENESASKSLQVQTYINQVAELEEKLSTKENTIDSQSAQIASLSCRISALESEVRLVKEEKSVIERNNVYLKNLCQKLESDKTTMGRGIENTDSEIQLYENKIKKLSEAKAQLEFDKSQIQAKVQSVESLLSTARREVIELKLALQDATSETKILKDQVNKLNEEIMSKHDRAIQDTEIISSRIAMEETVHSIVQDELEEELRHSRELGTRSSSYLHGSTI